MDIEAHQHLDLKGLQCPMPLLRTKQALNRMQPGERLWVETTDPGSLRDFPAFLKLSAHLLERQETEGDTHHFVILCGGRQQSC
ncbi:sulfurtransferase TusA family protein [Hahella sp. SMD15-11]|uniref:Sulfurtransferase TusA family protein n=1 Tax=Thermohahella caldifontis TaxID=3142973 RepID=A0AB39UX62_9GAMM